MQFMGTSSTDYKAFRGKHDRKLIVYTGQADPVFSAKYHTDWYDVWSGSKWRTGQVRSALPACSPCQA